MTKEILLPGIPLLKDYLALLHDPMFLEMENFSDNFLCFHKDLFRRYRWFGDPFHHWSRQWEYPFVFSSLRRVHEEENQNEGLKILDAGSGFTFFPYFLAEHLLTAEVTCCDSDTSLADMFASAKHPKSGNVNFCEADIRKLPFPDSFFDAIYCISVLEHTDNYRAALDEFKRVLKPGGVLVISFDISLDGATDIPIPRAQTLLNKLTESFRGTHTPQDLRLQEIVKRERVVTTDYFRVNRRELLPWKMSLRRALYFVKQIVSFKKPESSFKSLAFFCGVFKNKT